MAATPLISVCIPAYKNTHFLSRLLDSIAVQTFRDLEVVVTDDSPGSEVKALCDSYSARLPIRYFRNPQPLGSPENWNEAIRRSTGYWIKIMHDDDWFFDENSLAEYARAIVTHPEAAFIFSAYQDVFLEEHRTRDMFLSPARYKAFLKNRTILFGKNIIGPPSVVLYKKEGDIFFDRNVKWVVDIDFYIRYLNGRRAAYIGKMLVRVGLGSQQVTQDCFRLRPIEVPENFYLLNKAGVVNLRNLYVYDAWWRLMRNLEIRREEDISGSGYRGPIPATILSMVAWQRRIGRSLLHFGPVSKLLMLFHYILHYNKLPA
ncbi:MAG TPA: glycosyltransferase [Puia sp.]|uniref:glycosyltransferase family 2 protein n=1 Tax=Puia sp. TaxID=2045100 RepID=UPI002B823ABF|nr:glycosyltransferase [Puia sp.]HVU96486.1 glycosyltransferase [Puia sp.]